MNKLIKTGIITAIICVLLLFVTALIPRGALQGNMERSAEYFNTHEGFDHITENRFITRQDNYADCILTNIIYHVDGDRPIKSLVRAAYYNPENENVNKSFAFAVENEVTPNVDYSRYWHGSMVFLRPLFVFFNITGVRLVLGFAILIFTIIFEIILFKKGYFQFGICYLIGLFATSVWMAAFCIEYATTLLVLSVELLIYLLTFNKYGEESNDKSRVDKANFDEELKADLYKIILCAGIVTAFVDFLTVETLTFTMPFLFYLMYKEKNGSLDKLKQEIIILIKSGFVWLFGYAGMMILKWITAMAVLGPNAFVKAIKQAALRINGDATLGNVIGAENVSTYERISGALWRNIGTLLPFKSVMKRGVVNAFILLIIIITVSVWYLFRLKDNNTMFYMLLIVMNIPILRFMVLNNHSYIHFFFTYRAMLVSVTAWIYALLWLIFTYMGKHRRRPR